MTRLGDVCAIRYGKDHKKLSDGSIPTYGSGGIMRYVDTAICEQPSVLIPRKGTLGNLFYTDEPFWTVDTLFWTDIDQTKIVPKYLYYQLKQKDLASYNVGTAVPSLTVEVLNEIDLDVPSIDKQRRIVEVLNSFDSKIALNNQLNDYLEQLCQSLFDRFDNDENNLFVKVSDIADVNPRRTLKKGEEALCVEMADLSTTGAFPTDWRTKAYNGGVKFVNGDTILARITPCLENGKAGYINFLEQDEVAFGSTEYIVLTSKGELPSEFFYFLARNEDFISYATAHMNGSSGRQRVSGADVGNYEVRMPSEKQVSEFKEIAGKAMRVISASSIESRKLAQSRDALLPKLMSGEIDVSKVDLTQPTNNHLAGRMHWSTVIRVRAIHAVHSRQSQIPAYESVPRVLHSHATPP